MSERNRRRYRTRKAIARIGRSVDQPERDRKAKADRATQRAKNVRGVAGLAFLCLYIAYVYLVDGIKLSEYFDPGDSQFWFGTVPIFVVVIFVLKAIEMIAQKYFEANGWR